MKTRQVFVVLMMAAVLCSKVWAGDENKSVRTEKRSGEDVVIITGRIKSRHVSFRKGKSVRDYYVVTRDLIKIDLPRSHVEHRDGTISGINLRDWRSKDVELVCEGRVKHDPKEGLQVTVEKVISLSEAKG